MKSKISDRDIYKKRILSSDHDMLALRDVAEEHA